MQIIMPKLGLTMTHGTIIEWLKQPGDAVKAEEALCSYETEKVTLELVAPQDGVLGEILAAAGTTVPAGSPVCVLATDVERRGKGAEVLEGVSSSQLPASGFHLATPKARALARELGIDLTGIAGSGPEGRVQARDVEVAHAATQPAALKATPLARRMAAAEGIDLRTIAGTGTIDDIQQRIGVVIGGSNG